MNKLKSFSPGNEISFSSPNETATISMYLFRNQGITTRLKQVLRPYICPFHLLVKFVPDNSCLLDIGCGSGLFIGLLAFSGKLTSATGIDSSKHAIKIANSLMLPDEVKSKLTFEHKDAKQHLPYGEFSVVSLIDVMHHVPAGAQKYVLKQAIERLAPGGILIYKDMVSRPWWRAWANRAHDLILSNEWIYYFPFSKVNGIALKSGLEIIHSGSINILWYGHEWSIFQRPCRSNTQI